MVAVVGMMIVPLPTFALDVAISFNIALAITLLLIALYVSDGLQIATFPTLLLLTTLFRLALEVSATRLILLEANAGRVIAAFGNFVVAGNLVVGAVVFAYDKLLHGYQRARIDTFLGLNNDPLGTGYHVLQSKIAIGSAGLFGRGYLKGSQKAPKNEIQRAERIKREYFDAKKRGELTHVQTKTS